MVESNRLQYPSIQYFVLPSQECHHKKFSNCRRMCGPGPKWDALYKNGHFVNFLFYFLIQTFYKSLAIYKFSYSYTTIYLILQSMLFTTTLFTTAITVSLPFSLLPQLTVSYTATVCSVSQNLLHSTLHTALLQFLASVAVP